jgi:hypothetical protein
MSLAGGTEKINCVHKPLPTKDLSLRRIIFHRKQISQSQGQLPQVKAYRSFFEKTGHLCVLDSTVTLNFVLNAPLLSLSKRTASTTHRFPNNLVTYIN